MLTITSRTLLQKLTLLSRQAFSLKNAIINAPAATQLSQRESLKQNNWLTPDPTHKRSQQTHLSNGEYLIHKVPVIHSDSAIVRCIGGSQIGAGHPQVYIQLNTRTPGEAVSCKWCGLRFALKHHH